MAFAGNDPDKLRMAHDVLQSPALLSSLMKSVTALGQEMQAGDTDEEEGLPPSAPTTALTTAERRLDLSQHSCGTVTSDEVKDEDTNRGCEQN